MTDMMRAVGALAQSAPVAPEVTFSGTVLADPTSFVGTHTHARHEEFPARSDDGVNIDVIDNVDLAPWAPVHAGDRVTVQGELVGTPSAPVVHYTHHDPRHHHPDGYIELGGRIYA